MSGFLESLEKGTNKTARTANGAVSNKSTLDPVLDFFSKAGAMRKDPAGAYKLFEKAYRQDQNLALKALFYIRDIRGGQGERSTFRYIYSRLDQDIKDKFNAIVPEYGRWDDIDFDATTANLIKTQLANDIKAGRKGEPISLLAKWLPSANSHNTKTHQAGLRLSRAMGVSERNYRKTLSALRKYLKIVEREMSSREWGNIDFSAVPSQAMRKYAKAYLRHDDQTHFRDFLSKVEKGEAKINSSTAFTYEIYDMLLQTEYSWRRTAPSADIIRTADAMWKALPDYTNDANALVMADVSGSMTGRPMSISVTLALYFAERNKGLFKDRYMTFTDQPSIRKVSNGNIYDKLNDIEHSEVGYSTNLAAAFDAILDAAVDSSAKQEEIPETLYIISDMQFDAQMSNNKETNFETARRKFSEAGYTLPHVVFWNVNATGNDAPATKYDGCVTLISGSSQSTFKYAFAGYDPIESMLEVLNADRYKQITL